MAVRYACPDDAPGGKQRQFMVTRIVRDKGREMGLTVDQIIERARFAAPFTSDRANRRHKDIELFIEDQTIYGLWLMNGVESSPMKGEDDRYARRAPAQVRIPIPRELQQFRAVRVGDMIEADCPVCADDDHRGCVECHHTGRVRRTQMDWGYLLNEMGFL